MTMNNDALLINAKEAARMCGVSISTWYNLVSSGRTPDSVRICRNVRWRRGDLEGWVAAGCPSRDKWNARTG